jgi:hypothetical protein
MQQQVHMCVRADTDICVKPFSFIDMFVTDLS